MQLKDKTPAPTMNINNSASQQRRMSKNAQPSAFSHKDSSENQHSYYDQAVQVTGQNIV